MDLITSIAETVIDNTGQHGLGATPRVGMCLAKATGCGKASEFSHSDLCQTRADVEEVFQNCQLLE